VYAGALAQICSYLDDNSDCFGAGRNYRVGEVPWGTGGCGCSGAGRRGFGLGIIIVIPVAVGGVGGGVGAGGHGVEGDEVLLDVGPGFGILFCGEGEIEVGVVGEDVALDSGGDRGSGGEGEAVEEGGVGVVGEAVAGGIYRVASVQIAVC